MRSEAAAMQRALEAVWARLYSEVEGARFKRRGDLIVALYPPFRIPQCNGPWVVEDTQKAVDAMAGAIAEVEAAGAWPWVQTRSGHELTRRAAAKLGLTHREQIPGMVMQPAELVEPTGLAVEIDLITATEMDAANEILATCFGAPKELFDRFCGACAAIDEASWYVGRVDGEIVATALGITIDGVTGVFNVATAPEQRGRGHGAALTTRVLRDGFRGGSKLAFLQSSDIGHRLYRRLGFRNVEKYLLLTRPAPGDAA
jgi:ribosomal protein S18 acetylase RimI-like enzyme